MKLQLTWSIVTVLTLTVIPVAIAGDNILENADFESGELEPWYLDKDFGDEEHWNVTSADAHTGTYSATNVGNSSIRQDFDPVPTKDILQVSLWIRQPEAFINAIDYFYSDGSWEEFIVKANDQWQLFDVTSQLDVGKELTGFRVWGYFFGGGLEDRTYIDDVQLIVSGGDCPWDLDSNETVSTNDLLALFAQWGTAGPADFDESGAVDTVDLLTLLANWGPCP